MVAVRPPHFEHEASVEIFGRPFRNSRHGDSYLLGQWNVDLDEQDTVICLGGISIERPTNGLIDRLRHMPGRKILVAGNHDGAHIRRLRRAFDPVAACAYAPGEPELLMTHLPLDEGAGRLRERPWAHAPENGSGRAANQRMRRADGLPADAAGQREKAGQTAQSRSTQRRGAGRSC